MPIGTFNFKFFLRECNDALVFNTPNYYNSL